MSATSGAVTHTFDPEGNPVYPCRCGETHTGEYAAYEFGHHNCFHDAPLSPVVDDQYMCPSCGKDFWIGDSA